MEFSVGNAFGVSLRVWIRNLIPFTILSAIVHLPVWIWLYFIFKGEPTADKIRLIQAFEEYGGLVTFVLNMFLTATFTFGVVMELRGTRASLGRSVRVGLGRLLPATGAAVLALLASCAGLILLIVPGVIIYCALYVAVPASVVERPGIIGALRRSQELTKGRRWQVFGLLLLAFVALAAVAFLVGIVMDPPTGDEVTWASLRTSAIVNSGFEVFYSSFLSVVAAVTYTQLRLSKDGTDVSELARVFD